VEKKMNESFTQARLDARLCCFCGQPFGEFGNNPEPLNPYSERCCDDCNARVVIPARLRLLFGK
jgi:hypothetical protein